MSKHALDFESKKIQAKTDEFMKDSADNDDFGSFIEEAGFVPAHAPRSFIGAHGLAQHAADREEDENL